MNRCKAQGEHVGTPRGPWAQPMQGWGRSEIHLLAWDIEPHKPSAGSARGAADMSADRATGDFVGDDGMSANNP